MIYLLIYLIGCVLSYGRAMGSELEFQQLSDEAIEYWWNTNEKWFAIALIVLSWIGFALGVITYLSDKEIYFFKWTYKDLK